MRLPCKSDMVLVGAGEDGVGVGSVHAVVARRRAKADRMVGQAPVVTRRICELLVRMTLVEQGLVGGSPCLACSVDRCRRRVWKEARVSGL